MSRKMAVAVITTIVASLFGHVMASLPPTSFGDTSTFWFGNFSAPWAVLAFGVGWSQRRPAPAILVAVLAEVAAVMGFYNLPDYLTAICPIGPGGHCRDVAQGTPLVMAWMSGLEPWIQFTSAWLIAGVGAGIVYGYLGAWWARSRSMVPVVLLALPFFVEPLAWRVCEGHLKGPATVWVCEAIVGVGLLAVMTVVSRRQPVPEGA
jgi:hypothetical protein